MPKVSFDTFENPAASMFSFTLSAESVGYARTPQTRVFLCAASQDESGRQALDWALDSLVQDGDELVVFRGFDEDDLGASACNRLVLRSFESALMFDDPATQPKTTM